MTIFLGGLLAVVAAVAFVLALRALARAMDPHLRREQGVRPGAQSLAPDEPHEVPTVDDAWLALATDETTTHIPTTPCEVVEISGGASHHAVEISGGNTSHEVAVSSSASDDWGSICGSHFDHGHGSDHGGSSGDW